jgi:hypothetical protein
MVDALNRMRGWMKSDGCLIDLRPAQLVPTVQIGSPGCDHRLVGALVVQEQRRQRHVAADRALRQVLERKLFFLEQAREFSFLRYADSARELQEYIASRWQDTRMADATRARAEKMLHHQPAARLWLHERVGIRRLRIVDDGAP